MRIAAAKQETSDVIGGNVLTVSPNAKMALKVQKGEYSAKKKNKNRNTGISYFKPYMININVCMHAQTCTQLLMCSLSQFIRHNVTNTLAHTTETHHTHIHICVSITQTLFFF